MLCGVSNHQPHDCLLNRLFTHRSKKRSKLRVTDLCVGSPVNSPHIGPVLRKMFPSDDVIMFIVVSRKTGQSMSVVIPLICWMLCSQYVARIGSCRYNLKRPIWKPFSVVNITLRRSRVFNILLWPCYAKLIHCCDIVTAYGDINLGQPCFWWLVVWRHGDEIYI